MRSGRAKFCTAQKAAGSSSKQGTAVEGGWVNCVVFYCQVLG
jgi:hypothetical protein